MTRLAAVRQPAPTGDGEIVLHLVIDNIKRQIAAVPGTEKARRLQMVADDLFARAQEGKKKYGAMLRLNNGREAAADLYQEALDAVMYSAQDRGEGGATGYLVEYFIQAAELIAAVLEEKHAKL